MITITREASDYLKEFLRKESTKEKFKQMCRYDVKLTVEKTGCSGNKFVLRPITVREVCESTFVASDCHGIHVWTSAEDKKLVNGCKIEVEKDMLGTKLKITNESIPTSTCGCGESFRVDQDF